MRVHSLVVVLSIMPWIIPESVGAQDADRLEALVVATERSLAIQAERGLDVSDLVVERRWTAVGEADQQWFVSQLADRFDARVDVVERFCFPLPPTDRGFRQAEVRGVSAVLAPRIREWKGDSAKVWAITFRGQGRHTGGTLTISVVKTPDGWRVDEDEPIHAQTGPSCWTPTPRGADPGEENDSPRGPGSSP